VSDPKLHDEAGRVAALHRYEILDTAEEAAFDRITSLVRTVLDVPICTVSLIDADRQWFKSRQGVPFCETRRDWSFCTYTILERDPLVVPDAALDIRFAQNPLVVGEPFIRSYLGVPLATPDGYNVGSLCAIDMIPRSHGPAQIEILKSFAALVVDEMELRRIAHVDHLTGALTRRGFLHEVEKTLSRFRRGGHPATLLLLDLDHFKQVNDTYGHPAGDRVLRSVAQQLIAQLRQSDALGRLGGEEFGILLQDTGADRALQIAERLRAHLKTVEIPELPSIHVTGSFGVSVASSATSSPQQWLKIADDALYAAKRAGRDCCRIAEAPHAGTAS
jgi:diguanylate cyclase (GGDEF)-like protein